MEKLQNQNCSEGSTLLLAMVIVSTILFIGIGTGLLLSRQTREAVIMQNETVAFYVADSVIEEISLNPSAFDDPSVQHTFDFTESNVEYWVKHETGKRYRITVEVNNNYYYSFVREIKEDLVVDGGATIYFKKLTEWGDDVMVQYHLRNNGTSFGGTFFKKMINSGSVDYSDYMEYEIDFNGYEEDVEVIRFFFCEKDKVNNYLCTHDLHPGKKTGRHDVEGVKQQGTKVCQSKEDSSCIFPFMSFVNDAENSYIYFKKPTEWNDDIMVQYIVRDGNDDLIGSFFEMMQNSESTKYLGYMSYVINNEDYKEEAEKIRFFFCEEDKVNNYLCTHPSHPGKKTGRHDVEGVKQQGTKVCQSAGDFPCIFPFMSFVNISQ